MINACVNLHSAHVNVDDAVVQCNTRKTYSEYVGDISEDIYLFFYINWLEMKLYI